MQLFIEAENIREGLLQDSFSMRRSLELSLGDKFEPSAKLHKDWLEKVEHFHHSLEELNDRLSPAYIEDSLPLALQYALNTWKRRHPQLTFQMELPAKWRQEALERSRVILMALDELLRITLSKFLTETSIYIQLKPQGCKGELRVQITYPDESTLTSSSSSKDLDYLSQAFCFLTSGQCFHQQNNLTVTWCFRWKAPKDTPLGEW